MINLIFFLTNCHKVCDVILICESFLTKNSETLVNIPRYKCFTRNREKRPGGGIVILIKNSYTILETMVTPFTDVTESFFLKIKACGKIICVGEIYRIPNTDLQIFKYNYLDVLQNLSKEHYVTIGSDYSLDLIKASSHKQTAHFLKIHY